MGVKVKVIDGISLTKEIHGEEKAAVVPKVHTAAKTHGLLEYDEEPSDAQKGSRGIRRCAVLPPMRRRTGR